ncbi:MAG TPA: hypothetical protein VIC85_21570 [Ktedonobacterales bacterium]
MTTTNTADDRDNREAPAPSKGEPPTEREQESVGTTVAASTPSSPGTRHTPTGTTPISGTAPSAPAVPGNTPTDSAPDYGVRSARPAGQEEGTASQS